MAAAPKHSVLIEAKQLATWSVLTGGRHITLDFIDGHRSIQAVVLPSDEVPDLLMTLPRMLQSALDARLADGSLRFALNSKAADALGHASITTPGDIRQSPTRRAN
jgi:hypothetical protein